MRHRRGFTLLELMVVLVLFAITAAAAMPAFLATYAGSPEQRAAGAITAALLQARAAARESGASSTLVVAPADGRYWITTRDSSATGVIPLGNAVRLVADSTARVTCRFEARGPASPCTMTVRGARPLVIHVDAWNGEVTVDDGTH